MGLEGWTKRGSPFADQDVDHEEGDKGRNFLHGGSSGTDSRIQLFLDFCKSKPPLPVEVEVDPLPHYHWTLSESALHQFSQEKSEAFDLVTVTNCMNFDYANHSFYHINFEARPQNPGVAEPSMKLFFAEVTRAYPKSPVVTCCRPIEPTDKVTEGCMFCPRGGLVIHPISDVMKIDRRFSPGKHINYGKYRDMASCLHGIPPWQLNHPCVVQAYNDRESGYYQSDEGITGELSLEEYQNFRKTRVHQLSEAILEDLKNEKGMYLKLVQGLEYSTFKFREHTFHHLNFEAKPQGPHDELSTRRYFAEVISNGGAYRITFCCVVDPADKVLEICGFCYGRGVIHPDISLMDLEPGKTENVLYVDLKLDRDLQSMNHRSLGLPCMFPSLEGFTTVNLI